VGEPGRNIIREKIEHLKTENKIDFTIANAENAAGGKGLTADVAREIIKYGVNVITTGNHTFARKEIIPVVEDVHVLRPANYPAGVPGHGWWIYELDERKIAVMSLMGRVYMPITDCPFIKVSQILQEIIRQTKIIVVDFHAEITSEKNAMGWYLNGRVSAVIGTHTHIQTSDERVLPEGTAYITDVGMTGPSDGIIGVDREIILKRYLTAMPYKFSVAKGEAKLDACVINIDDSTGRALSIKRINETGLS
ncbi:MAG: TIGR00282 family metallophosphoesterase, partial [Elusimicrobiota bacterium]